jgi:DNA-binding transcriptional ArsR family regulator
MERASSDAVVKLGALAHESRLAVFRQLVRRGPKGLSAGEIAEQQGIAAPNASFHLAELVRAGLLRSRREGRNVIYSADFEAIQGLVNYLRENCCAEGGALCAPALVPSSTLFRRSHARDR